MRLAFPLSFSPESPALVAAQVRGVQQERSSCGMEGYCKAGKIEHPDPFGPQVALVMLFLRSNQIAGFERYRTRSLQTPCKTVFSTWVVSRTTTCLYH